MPRGGDSLGRQPECHHNSKGRGHKAEIATLRTEVFESERLGKTDRILSDPPAEGGRSDQTGMLRPSETTPIAPRGQPTD